MLNPQLNLSNSVPSPKELWKDEKSKYRHWIVIFSVGILVIFALLLASAIFNLTGRGEIVQKMNAFGDANFKGDTLAQYKKGIDQNINLNYIAFPFIKAFLVFIGVILFFITLYKSYKMKSFSHLSTWPTVLIGLGAFFAFYDLIKLIWNPTLDTFASKGGLFQFVNNFIVIAVFIFGSRKISQIRRLFAASERYQKLKDSPEFKKMQEMMSQMGGAAFPNFGTPMNNVPTTNPYPDKSKEKEAIAKAAQKEEELRNKEAKSKEKLELEKMSITELKKVAQKLSISGYSTMSKEELIEAILRVSSIN